MLTRFGNAKDLAVGLVFVVVGLAFGGMSIELDIGTARRMGPGYFPLFLSGVLVLLGAAIVWQGLRQHPETIGHIPWRGLILVVVTPVLFGLTLRGVGLVPAILGVVLVSATASAMSRVLSTVLLAVALSAFCALVFVKALNLPIQLVGPWLSFASAPLQPAPAGPEPAKPASGN
jgi:hypothetical protein